MRAGLGRLKAELVAGATRLTDISSSSPARLFPLQSALATNAGAAGFVVGGYGGGVLGGDTVDIHLSVGPGATLVGRTQGHTKIYRAKKDEVPAKQTLKATIGDGGLFVFAPDPVMPYTNAKYIQQQTFELSPEASLIVVDGVTCGRASQGERWDFREYRSKNEYIADKDKKLLSDSIALDAAERGRSNWSMDIGGTKRDAFASVVAVGPRASAVGAELVRLGAQVTARNGARVAASFFSENDKTLPNLGGSVWMGVTQGIPGGRTDAIAARIVAEFPEDIVRILCACMQPLESALGDVPYADRVHGNSAAQAPIMAKAPNVDWSTNSPATRASVDIPDATGIRGSLDAHQIWTLLQLADPTLPIGGFAHSGGLEVAMQLGLFGRKQAKGKGVAASNEVLVDYLTCAAGTSARQYAPFAAASHRCITEALNNPSDTKCLEEWPKINKHLAAFLAPVAPAHRASVAQGAALLQATEIWLRATSSPESPAMQMLAKAQSALSPSETHFSCAMGLVGALLKLPMDATLDALGFATSRALVAAAVRLNLVGPQRAVGLQAALSSTWINAAASSDKIDPADAYGPAPLLDTVHGVHNMLEARVFHT
eukprot:gnl/MRDRNA2_/MRDRNA2_30369_c0_seq1.p1 gnl/MRDRNA2_/MRDRNA2_30369_c0~~gnl/MRDRNA2_/MRDRNA2_30369_c0_seq1.p1  ORF type:complete len:601 (+),score=122.00 gnl/MRDRNA2_/MRDRNA2_30369_c0_seq1:207-2009(+)